MLRIVLLVLLFWTTSFALAQQADPVFMQRAISALQTQRNSALDAQVVAEAKVTGLTEDLNKANAKIKELEEQLKPKDTPKK
jgi:TolA-binding protein